MKKSGQKFLRGGEPTRVVFRLDDISAASDDKLQSRIFEEFFDKRVPLTVGVIPFIGAGDVHDPEPQGELALSAEKLSFLAECRLRGGFEIAQHGCSHQVLAGAGFRTEFAGLPFCEQSRSIARGKARLETFFPVASFIPPWNSYDEGTLRAVSELGFRAFSADAFGPLLPGGSLQYLPATTSLAGLPAAIDASRSARAARSLIVVVMHAYDFRESGSSRATWGICGLRALLGDLPRDGRFEYRTLEGCAAEGGYGAAALASAKQRARIARHLPAFFRRAFAPDGVVLYLRERAQQSGAPAGMRSARASCGS